MKTEEAADKQWACCSQKWTVIIGRAAFCFDCLQTLCFGFLYIYVAYTWTVDTVYLVTCFSPAFEGGRKSIVSALHTISAVMTLQSSQADDASFAMPRCMEALLESINRAQGRGVGVLNVTRHPMSSRWRSQSPLSQPTYIYTHTMKHIWAHSNPLACTLLTGSIRVKKTPQAI